MMKTGTLAALLSLAGLAASAVVQQQQQQQPVTAMKDGSRPAWDGGYEGQGLRFKLGSPGSRLNRSQCAVTELKWTKTVGPYHLDISVRPTEPRADFRTVEVIEDIDSTSYPVLIRGPGGGAIRVRLTDAVGATVGLATMITPSSDDSCLD